MAAGPELSPKQIYQRTLRSTCLVLTRQASGTGWLVDEHRKKIVTNYHVVGTNDSVTLVFPAFAEGRVIPDRNHYQKRVRQVRGKVLSKDPQRDLALIEAHALPADFTALPLARESAGPGDLVHTVGNPGASGALWVYTSGTVRTEVYRKRLKLLDGRKPDDGPVLELHTYMFETQAPINPGDSGGPVVNDRAELVGVNCATTPGAQQVTSCIDVREVKAFLNDGPAAVGRPAAAASGAGQGVKLRDEGVALLRRGDYQAAVDRLSQAVSLNPRDFLAYNERGAAYTWLDRDAEAVEDFTRAIALNDQHAVFYRNRGAALLRLGKLQEAVQDFTRAIALNDRYARAYHGRSEAFTRLGKAREAQADYQRAVALDPSLKK
jgi:tetratricopeptide (TPR) repeat protein